MATGLAIASIATTVIGGAATAVAQKRQGEAQNAVAQYNARMQEYNRKKLLEQQKDTQRQAAQQVKDIQKSTKQMREEKMRRLGQIKSRMSGGGVVLDTGSPLEFLIDTEAQQNLAIAENMKQRFGTVERLQQASGQQGFQAYMQGAEANLSRTQGQYAKQSGNNAAFGTVLSTAGSSTGMYSQYKKQGIF